MARRSRSRLADDKPKTRKAQARASRAEHLTSDEFFDFIDRISAHQTEADEAGMALAAAYKDTDKLGIHRQAAKLFKRMDSKEQPQRNDMLRSFYRFVGWAIDTGRWEGLTDLVDVAEGTQQQDQAAEPSRASAREQEVAEPQGTEAPAGDIAAAAEAEAAIGPVEAHWQPGDERPQAEINKDLETGGFTFAAGRQAGQEGAGPDANPHGPKLAAAKIWESGRLQGANESPLPDEPGIASGDEPASDAAPTKAGRRKAAANGQAALH